jgi:CheY-like chemotaxis protein
MTTLAGTAVLVVDDDVDNIELLSFAIEHAGGSVRSANDAVAALHVLGTWVPDILLIDLSMPRMDGYELLATLRSSRTFAQIPAVAVTAEAFDGVKERCIEAGFAEYVTKPFDVDALLALIETLVRASATRIITPPSGVPGDPALLAEATRRR